MNNYGSFLSPSNFEFNLQKLNTERNINARVSGVKLTTMVSKVKYSVPFEKILTMGTNFEEISAFPEKSSHAVIRKTKTRNMTTNNFKNFRTNTKLIDKVRSIKVKFDGFTVIFYRTYFDIFGVDAWDLAKDAIIENGWATDTLREKLVEFQLINGKFSLGKKVNTEKFARAASVLDRSAYEVHFGIKPKRGKGGVKMLERYNYQERNLGQNFNEGYDEEEQVPVGPALEYVKRKIPAVIIKYKPARITYQVFSSGIVLFSYPGNGMPDDIRKFFVKILFSLQYAFENVNEAIPVNKNYPNHPIARQLGRGGFAYKVGKESFTVIPPHGFYIRPGPNQKPRLYKWLNMKLTKKNATMVAKAYANAKVNIPNHTRKVFKNEFGLNLEVPSENKKVYANTSNRRAPSWNATKPGFYVRPGPGKQPYWAAIPAGINAGRKTVVKRYTNAGVNIPQSVRNIFKIGTNVKTAGNRTHNVTMGNNDILRINGRQVTRLTKPELLAIAKNLGIPQATNSSNKTNLIRFIKNHRGLKTKQEVGEARGKELAQKRKEEKVEAKKVRAAQQKPLEEELQIKRMVKVVLGNKYTNQRANNFITIYRGLPSGQRGKPLKANLQKALEKFANTIKRT